METAQPGTDPDSGPERADETPLIHKCGKAENLLLKFKLGSQKGSRQPSCPQHLCRAFQIGSGEAARTRRAQPRSRYQSRENGINPDLKFFTETGQLTKGNGLEGGNPVDNPVE
jgi:hypothetical protein